MRSAIQLQIYLAFFREGMIPKVKLSKINARGKARLDQRNPSRHALGDKVAARLYHGLQTLEST